MYIDDIILMAHSESESICHMQIAVDLLHFCSFYVHPDKIVAACLLEVLSLQVNVARMELQVQHTKIHDICRQIHTTLLFNEGH